MLDVNTDAYGEVSEIAATILDSLILELANMVKKGDTDDDKS
jgi:hypothetical protein